MSAPPRPVAIIERACWCAAVLIVAGSYYALTTSYDKQIGALQAASQNDFADTLRNRQLAANATKARTVTTQLERRVAAVVRDKPAPVVIATLVRDLDGLAAANGCRLMSVVPSASEAPVTPVKVRGPRRGETPLPFMPFADVEFVVRGDYRGVLHVLAGASAAHTLVDVQNVSLALYSGGPRRDRRVILDAKIHATVFRYVPARWGLAS